MNTIDLHVHSTCSDGTLTPAELDVYKRQTKTCTDPAPQNLTGSCSCILKVCQNRLTEGNDGNDEHKCHREQEHLVVLAHRAKPCSDSQKSECC